MKTLLGLLIVIIGFMLLYLFGLLIPLLKLIFSLFVIFYGISYFNEDFRSI